MRVAGPIKRFVLCAYDDHDAGGGFKDYIESFDTAQEAVDFALRQDNPATRVTYPPTVQTQFISNKRWQHDRRDLYHELHYCTLVDLQLGMEVEGTVEAGYAEFLNIAEQGRVVGTF